MPEAPDLEVIKDFLNHEVQGQEIESCRVLRPTVLRSLAGDFPIDILGRVLGPIDRRGKFLSSELSGSRWLVINPMLTGALQYCDAKEHALKKTCFTLTVAGDRELRYLDERQMGTVYYVTGDQMSLVPRLHEQGPDVLDGISFEEFQQRLKKFRGEIKGVLTRGAFISGIGTAYADEILFAASISPFRKSRSLVEDELKRLYKQCTVVVNEAITVLRERTGEDIHVKIRDFLKVHRKGGQACPRCRSTISELTSNRRITSYCRRCQPGMLLKN